MVNVFLELEDLRAYLLARGVESDEIDSILNNAEKEISQALRDKLDQSLDYAVQVGVEKDSTDFINDLRPRYDAFIIETQSGDTVFTEPPFPMLDRLLSGSVKSMKDGSGVYKVIPVGTSNKSNKSPIHTNIFDAQKSMMAQRHEETTRRYSEIIPSGSKANFRTATSKQNRNEQWVIPAKEKDFTGELEDINYDLKISHDEIILDIINSYKERF